jgi:hypothetical protein
MAALTSRYELLRSRLTSLGKSAAQLGPTRPGAVDSSRAALRRIRVVLPLLKLDPAVSEKLETRLRKTEKHLKKVRDIDAIVGLMDDLHESDRHVRQALGRIREDVRRSLGWPKVTRMRGEVGSEVRRLAAKLTDVSKALKKPEKHPLSGDRTVGPIEARAARRAEALHKAIVASGSVYLSDRLRAPRRAVTRLRADVELLTELSTRVSPADVRLLQRTQVYFDRIRDLERLIEEVRDAQSALRSPDAGAWHGLDSVIIALENRCRRLHARYVRDRQDLLDLCDRLSGTTLRLKPEPTKTPRARKVKAS